MYPSGKGSSTTSVRVPTLALLAFAAIVPAASAQVPPPSIFFTDLQSGPNTGGEDNNGVFVTLYGKNFGTARGTSTVTVGGGQVASYRIWGEPYLWYQKLVVQLGPAARTGNIVVATSSGVSNPVPFTVRAGNIYFASTTGTDSSTGSFGAPFRTIRKCKNALASGDTCYVMNGVSETAGEDYRAALILGERGTATAPRALVTYPGASATIGNNSLERGVFTCSGLASCPDGQYWVLAGFNLYGTGAALEINTSNNRAVANKIQCPNGDGAEACLSGGHNSSTIVLGNEVTNAGKADPSKLYHSVYFSTDANNVEVGWNWVHNSRACRGIQFHSTGGSPQYGLSVHDNLIHDIRCDGINFATVDPSKGKVEAYNNVVFNAGTGPDFPEGAANYSCLFVGQDGGTGTVNVFNNTFYNCGSGGAAQYGTSLQIDSTVMTMQLRNNIVRQDNARSYVRGTKVTGSNNLWFGNGSGPSVTSGNVNADPKFVDLASRNFHLQSGSPAINAGVAVTGLNVDRDGVLRPQGASLDIGAYEFFTGTVTPPSNPCDLDSDGIVDRVDIQTGTDQALGRVSCGNSDINNDGLCNVVDVQRVINASLGAGCRTTP